MEQAIICRIGFCPKCFKAGRPYTDDRFYPYGSDRGFNLQFSVRQGIPGFVPFNYIVVETRDDQVFLERSCAMYNCGVDHIVKDNEDWDFFIKEEAWEKIVLSKISWKALIVWEDEYYRI